MEIREYVGLCAMKWREQIVVGIRKSGVEEEKVVDNSRSKIR